MHLERRIEALESASRSASTMALDLDALPADDGAFVEPLGISETSTPNYSALSVPDLRRLSGIVERHERAN